ncbi:unnamed protein product [Ectocarpus sp. CCAP 1310/34]|nr:unnamed protein product [Ectocarpus sp. CCAP 1310/34]
MTADSTLLCSSSLMDSSVTRLSIVVPPLSLAGVSPGTNLHAQTTDEFKEYLAKECNTLAWYGPSECTEEMDMRLEQSDNLERWETAALTASDGRVLITQWIGAAMARLNSQQAFRFRLFEKCGMVTTVDGSGNDRITLEGLDKSYTFANDKNCSEDEEGLENGSDEPEGQGKEGDGRETVVEGADSSDDEHDCGTSQTQTDELALLDDDDSMDPQDPEHETQGMEIPTGFRIQEVKPVALDKLLLRRGVLVRLGMGWFEGLIIQQSQQDTRHLSTCTTTGARPEYAQDEAALRQPPTKWFLWVAAFCVLVAICGLCSCYMVTPLVRSCRELLGVEHGRQPKGVVVRQDQHVHQQKHHQQRQEQQERQDRGRPRETGEREKCDARDSKSHRQRHHHWYLDDLLKITPEDEVEFGVRHSPAYTVTPTPRASRTASGLAPQSRRHNNHPQHRPRERRASFPMSSMSSRGEPCSRSVLPAPVRRKSSDNYYDDYHAHNRSHSVSSETRRAVAVVDDPGIGAEATLRGGGWMGAANGRL